jgi:phage-related protein (TIGR01555 family)
MKRQKLLPVSEFTNEAERSLQAQLGYIQRINSIASEQLGIGNYQGDPLELVSTVDRQFHGAAARREYRGLDIVQRIIDSPAKDALRAGYEVETNFDDIGIGPLIKERLEELRQSPASISDKFFEYLRNPALYSKGAMCYPVILETGMEPGRTHLSKKLLPKNVERIQSLNIPPEDFFNYQIQSYDALALGFGELMNLSIHGTMIHPSRVKMTILNPDMFRDRGTSTLDRIVVACKALNIAEWTIANLLLRYRALIAQYPSSEIHQQDAKKKARFKQLARDIMLKFSSKSVAMVPDNFKFEYLQTTFTGMNEATNFLYEYLASVTGRPQSIIKGAARGEIAAAEKDQRDYYEMVQSEEQQAKLIPFFKYLEPLILNERRGEIYQILMQHGIDVKDVEVEYIFNPMQSVNPMQDAQIEQIKAQTGAIDVSTGIRNTDEVRRDNHPHLDSSSSPPVEIDDTEGLAAAMQSLFDDQGQLKPASNLDNYGGIANLGRVSEILANMAA